ncbi:MAG: hypothetical protein HOE86_29080, partial [Gemmatimonadetes bacterium]|nr:hypothetical protein [Gemmatimonadota bacterium]
MNRLLYALLCSVLAGSLCAAEDEVVPADPQHVWDLTDLYPDVDAWSADREAVIAKVEQISARRGTLGDSAESLHQTLA